MRSSTRSGSRARSTPIPGFRSGPRASCPRWPWIRTTATSTPHGRTSGSAAWTRSPSRCRRTAGTTGPTRSRSETPPSADPGNEQAWVPGVDVSDDGTIAVTSYDFRFNTSAPGVPTDHWMVHCDPSATTTCADAGDWSDEVRLIDTSFGVVQLPLVRGPFGYFVGEY